MAESSRCQSLAQRKTKHIQLAQTQRLLCKIHTSTPLLPSSPLFLCTSRSSLLILSAVRNIFSGVRCNTDNKEKKEN
ncbi:hypothetical protein Peur_045762 [Populus x canadensis]